MTLAIILTLSLSTVAAITAANALGILAGCVAWVATPITSLDFWLFHKLTGYGPSNFIPNWIAGAMILCAAIVVALYVWGNHCKEQDQEEVSK